MSDRLDTSKVLNGLKGFQRATVDYVFDRFYGPNPTRRFLVADEVGLGKTLVARGLIARTIEHLSATIERIDIIYICSNADIARQNVQRLSIPGCEITAQSTRLTLLPVQMHELGNSGVNFVALTPGTSFEQTEGGGRVEERVLLYCLLDRAWKIDGSRASLYVMQDYVKKTETFERALEVFRTTQLENLNEELAQAFVSKLEGTDLRLRFEELRRIFCRSDARVEDDDRKKRTQWIGELRKLLASVCLAALEPDLIILDEFQRFKHLLEEETPSGQLAHDLFDSDAGLGARVLLLSATPYKGLSLHHEADDDHYSDFLGLLQFLENGAATGCEEVLAEYRAALPAVRTSEGLSRLRNAKQALEQRLRRVMARTERLAIADHRGGMLSEANTDHSKLEPVDVRAFLGAQRIAEKLNEGDIVEYWKSAPYLFNFMDSYTLKHSFNDSVNEREMVRLVREFPVAFLDLNGTRKYQPLEPANPRLRGLIADTLDRGLWRLLWIPSTINYYSLSGPFAAPDLPKPDDLTKRLVFSAWHMVPRAVSSIVSYEAERRMMRAAHSRAQLTHEDWKTQRGLLRFGTSAGRLTGMPLLLLVYPCLTFARDCDPRELARSGPLTAKEVCSILAERIRGMVEKLGIVHETTGNADERWYWLTPMLLDFAEFPAATRAWWERPDLAQAWSGSELGQEDGWYQHVEEAERIIREVRSGSLRLGQPPSDPDLYEVLAMAASAAPATAALRAFSRANGISASTLNPVRDAAGKTGLAFRSHFNHAEIIEMIRAVFHGEPYWLRVLEYAHAGGLQALLDEYMHLLGGSPGLADAPIEKRTKAISNELVDALTLQTASLHVDEISAPPYAREVKIEKVRMRTRFALRFGDERGDEETPPGFPNLVAGSRKERVRAAFNSPFWPFVLISTSVGQEGLDFHHYCHAITHWNLPSNPVDMEQREGRVHRYKGHAVRKNLAAAHGTEVLRDPTSDVWSAIFRLGRPENGNGLVPYWLFPGDAKIQRHVPALPFSREVDRLHAMRRALAIYRMVFGQSRQEDLISYLLSHIPEAEQPAIVAELQIDMSPPGER